MLATMALALVPERAGPLEAAVAPLRQPGLPSASAPQTCWAGAAAVAAVAICGCRAGTNKSRRRQRDPLQPLPVRQQGEHGSHVAMASKVSEPLPMEEFSEQDDSLSYFLEPEEQEDADYVEVLEEFKQDGGSEGETASTEEEDEYWDTGLDFVPEYDEDYEYEGPSQGPERTPGIEVARLVCASEAVGSTEVDGAVLDLGLEIDWKGGDEGGWSAPVIRKPLDLRLSPGCAALHGGALAAEDLFAVRSTSTDGTAQLLKASPPLQRLQAKCLRAGLPSDWKPADLEACLASLVKVVSKVVPEYPEGAMLVQVAVIGTETTSGLNKNGRSSAVLVAVARLVRQSADGAGISDLIESMTA